MSIDYASGLRSDLNGLFNEYGTNCIIKFFNPTLQTGSYNSFSSLAQSGADLYFSGISFPINSKSSTEMILLEQGTIESDDRKLYVDGNTINASGNFRIMIGSATTGDYYQVLDGLGVQTQRISNANVFHKMWLRKLTTGSLMGES